jgi:hypothetical protein
MEMSYSEQTGLVEIEDGKNTILFRVDDLVTVQNLDTEMVLVFRSGHSWERECSKKDMSMVFDTLRDLMDPMNAAGEDDDDEDGCEDGSCCCVDDDEELEEEEEVEPEPPKKTKKAKPAKKAKKEVKVQNSAKPAKNRGAKTAYDGQTGLW